ncbi:hypothetical protein N9W20_00215 [Candidatus Pelagibacter bacterium]|nr:hypothetical protein [Candidatus Pelagibacter bacterium]
MDNNRYNELYPRIKISIDELVNSIASHKSIKEDFFIEKINNINREIRNYKYKTGKIKY